MAKKTVKKTTRSTRGRKTASTGASKKSPQQGAAQTGPMSLPLLEQLVKLMSANELTNIELQDGPQRIVLSRGGPSTVAIPAPTPVPQAPAQAAPAPPPPAASATASGDAASTAGLVEIKSPMVGTFYVSPSPDAKAFVQIGDKIGPDSDVCIIEAMKVFNNIKAEVSGTIERCLVESGSAVEYGQGLFLVRP